MKKYILYIILIAIMITSFFISGLFFANSGLINFKGDGIDNEKSIQILTELDKLPMVSIDVYNIIFQSYGELAEINKDNIILASSSGEKEIFVCDIDLSEFNESDKVMLYYNYLPEGGKKIIKIKRIERL